LGEIELTGGPSLSVGERERGEGMSRLGRGPRERGRGRGGGGPKGRKEGSGGKILASFYFFIPNFQMKF